MQVNDSVVDIALKAYDEAIAQEMPGEGRSREVSVAVQRDAMRKAIARVARLALTPVSKLDVNEVDDSYAEQGVWPTYPSFEYSQLAINGSTSDRLAVTPGQTGASLFIGPADTFLQIDQVTVFDLPTEKALELSDALSRAAGRIPAGAVTIDKRKADYLFSAEAQLRKAGAYLRRLPLNAVTASQIAEIDDVLASDPSLCK